MTKYNPEANPHFTIGTMAATITGLLEALENTKAPKDVVKQIQYDVAIELATEYMESYDAYQEAAMKEMANEV